MITFDNILNIYNTNSKIKFDKYKSKHWKIMYGDKYNVLTKDKVINFRNNYLSKGLDDSYYSQRDQKKIYFDALKKIGKRFILKNLNKKNVGNFKKFLIIKNFKIDINELFHVVWVHHLRNFVNNLKIVCEIGGGYGSLAEKIIKNYNCKYILIDLPETNVLSSFYLSRNFPKKKLYLGSKKKFFTLNKKILDKYDIFILPPWYLLQGFKVNFFINTRSFMEMDKKIVESYFKLIHQRIAKNGIFLNINRYKKKTVDRPIFFYQYPYDKKWSVLYSKSSWMQSHCHHLLARREVNPSNMIEQELYNIKKLTIIDSFKINKFFFKNLLPRFIYRYLLNLKRRFII